MTQVQKLEHQLLLYSQEKARITAKQRRLRNRETQLAQLTVALEKDIARAKSSKTTLRKSDLESIPLMQSFASPATGAE